MQEDDDLNPEESLSDEIISSNSELTIHGLIKNEHYFKKLVNLTKEEFNHLLEEAFVHTFNKQHSEEQQERSQHKQYHSIPYTQCYFLPYSG